MSAAALVGAVLGVTMAALGRVVVTVGGSPLVAAVLAVAAGAALTRGLHLDGLADTVDALGSHRDADAALAIMRRPDIGPFGVVTLTLTLAAQVAAAAVVLARPWPAALAGIVSAVAGGRVAIAMACRRGVPAARPEGLGALVAGTVRPVVAVVTALAVTAIAIPAVPGRLWQGPLAVALGLLVAVATLRHIVGRLRGVTGDVLGAMCELTTTAIYIVLSM
jgi:adenosylcobinamide-GDP ribazoletransferase